MRGKATGQHPLHELGVRRWGELSPGTQLNAAGTFQKLGHNCWDDLGFAEDIADFPLLCFSLSAGRRDILGQFLSGENDKDLNVA